MIIALQTLVFFRESLLAALERAIAPYYKRIILAFSSNEGTLKDEEPDEQVFSEFDDEKGVIFFPPMYVQRYAAVSDCLMDERWRGKLEKVVDFGYHDVSFIKYLKEVPGIKYILGVDIESMYLTCFPDLFCCDDYVSSKKEGPLQITLFQGNAADPDYRLIGCDAVIAIEMIEHMLPHDLDRLVHTVFGFIKPWIAIFTTPNGDFNVLFKSLEKNGYRRLDHFFEWTREQFNDWCSNIIVRYPLYTVVCQGIGPGPPGTNHLGCCSQLALFINTDYTKQPDCYMDSLALVPKAPSPKPLSELIDCWESTDNIEHCTQTSDVPDLNFQTLDSVMECPYTDDPLCMPVPLTPKVSNTTSYPFLPKYVESDSTCIEEEYISKSDKMMQCDLDVEFGKNFLMFDEYQFVDIRVPRRRKSNRVYEIGDVASRLNCTTFRIKSFSKTTQNLLARNKIDMLGRTREVVDEICHLTKTLKINNSEADRPDDNLTTWHNINWGENAPYWNQFYRIVGEYNYPSEAKSDDCRLLDLLTDEINRLIDTHFADEPCNVNRLEIPMSHLMSVVRHLTVDVDAVRDLLEWNGYEIVDDVVIHSRFVVGSASVATHDEDSQDIETNLSDWDNITEVRSTTLSEGSTIVPDYHDRCLRRALDHKVRNLRTMLTADEDISMELDKVMCRLMRLALRTSKGCSNPPSLKWMQCKLLDLLTLTERAIEHRKKHLIENSWKAIEFGNIDSERMSNFAQDDYITKKLVNKYQHIILPDADLSSKSALDTSPADDAMSVTSAEFIKELEYEGGACPHDNIPPEFIPRDAFEPVDIETELDSIEKTKAWLNVEVTDHNQDVTYVNSSEDTDIVSNKAKKQNKSKHAIVSNKELEASMPVTTSSSKPSSIKSKFKLQEKKRQTSTTRVTKKVARNNAKICGHYSNKLSSFNNQRIRVVRSKRMSKENRCLTMRASKPIPESLINLCHPELKVEKCIKEFNVLRHDNVRKIVNSYQPLSPKVSNEDNMLKNIIMDDTQMYDSQDNTTLHRSIGIDAEEVGNISRKDIDNSGNGIDLNLCTRHEVSTENIYAQTIFLNDINEPSTSKGIRHHVSMDVQCGPDALAAYPMLSASTSLVRLSPVLPGIKIHDGTTDTKCQNKDFGTTTQDNENDVILTPRSRSVGIKIKDSDVNICTSLEEYTVSKRYDKSGNQSPILRCSSPHPRSWSPESSGIISDSKVLQGTNTINSSTKTDCLPISGPKTEDSSSEFSTSGCSFQKSYPHVDKSEKRCELLSVNPYKHKNTSVVNSLNTKWKKPKLGYGGIDVHSYKDKQESVDIVYQGEWQQYRLKTIRKKTRSSISMRKYNDSSNRKQNDTLKEKKVNSKEISDKKIQKSKILELRKSNSTCKKNKSHSKLAIYNKNILQRPLINIPKVPSKIAVCSSKHVKSAFTAKKPQIKANVPHKDVDYKKNINKKSYVPSYLLKKRQNAEIIEKINLKNSTDSAADNLKKKETVKSKTDEIRRDLLKFHDNVPKNTFLVFHNKNQENCSSTDKQQIPNVPTNESDTKQDDSFVRRARSPPSLNSSTCSSLNSIATVRAVTTKSKNFANKRHSASSYKNSLNISGSENTTPTKTKKSIVKTKNAKRSDSNKDTNNKENIPDTTKNLAKKETEKFLKSPFVGKHKSVCIAQLKTDRSLIQTTTLSKHKTSNKSIIKIPNLDDAVERKRSLSMSPTRKRSQKCETSINNNNPSNADMPYRNLESVNMILELTPQNPINVLSEPETISQTDSISSTINNNLLSRWIEKLPSGSQTSNSMNYMRNLIEDMLLFVDSEPVTGYHVNTPNYTEDLDDSMYSFKTTTETDNMNKSFTESDYENSLDYVRTYESILQDEESGISSACNNKMTVNNMDLLSFKSITSNSKHSEYYLSDSVLNNAIATIESTPSQIPVRNPPSVTGIFERKEAHVVQKQPGFLANQAFSGFSLDGEPVSGDKPDPIALIDSETGSMAMAMGRQATSEELFISGRSSESYESCVIDEDSVVPNWLFQIISQQQSHVAENQSLISQPLPLMVEPRYDVNGNSVEPGIVGVDAGAGDGCGIHSDQSQDSSGRGTSLSSSETSSSQVSQNEDMIVEPLGFTGQFEMVRNSRATPDVWSAGTLEASPTEEHHRNAEETDPVQVTSHSRRRPRTQFNVVSGVDADISSIDTDVPDSSDNN